MFEENNASQNWELNQGPLPVNSLCSATDTELCCSLYQGKRHCRVAIWMYSQISYIDKISVLMCCETCRIDVLDD